MKAKIKAWRIICHEALTNPTDSLDAWDAGSEVLGQISKIMKELGCSLYDGYLIMNRAFLNGAKKEIAEQFEDIAEEYIYNPSGEGDDDYLIKVKKLKERLDYFKL